MGRDGGEGDDGRRALRATDVFQATALLEAGVQRGKQEHRAAGMTGGALYAADVLLVGDSPF